MPTPNNPFGMPPQQPTQAPADTPSRLTSTEVTEAMKTRFAAANTLRQKAAPTAVRAHQVLQDFQTTLTTWNTTQNAGAKTLNDTYATKIYKESRRLQRDASRAAITGLAEEMRDERRKQRYEKYTHNAQIRAGFAVATLGLPPLALACAVGSIVAIASREQAKRNHVRKNDTTRQTFEAQLSTREETENELREALKAERDMRIIVLNGLYAEQQQAINIDNSLSLTEKTTLLKDADNIYRDAYSTYLRLHDDRVANAEDVCNRGGAIAQMATAKPDFSLGSDFRLPPERLAINSKPLADGDKFHLGTALLQLQKTETKQRRSPEATVKTSRLGISFEINFSEFKTRTKDFRRGDYIPKSDRYKSSLIINCYVDAYRTALQKDPNLKIDLRPIIMEMKSDEETRELIDKMVEVFGNVPMGMEEDIPDGISKIYRGWKNDAINARYLNVDLGSGNPAPLPVPPIGATGSTSLQASPPPPVDPMLEASRLTLTARSPADKSLAGNRQGLFDTNPAQPASNQQPQQADSDSIIKTLNQ